MKLLSGNDVFALLETAAVEGKRCPKTTGPDATPGLKSQDICDLARAGRIFIEISSQNFRRVTILTGPHAGRSTAPDPKPNARVFQTIGTDGKRINGKLIDSGARRRPKPSAPRFLTPEELA